MHVCMHVVVRKEAGLYVCSYVHVSVYVCMYHAYLYVQLTKQVPLHSGTIKPSTPRAVAHLQSTTCFISAKVNNVTANSDKPEIPTQANPYRHVQMRTEEERWMDRET